MFDRRLEKNPASSASRQLEYRICRIRIDEDSRSRSPSSYRLTLMTSIDPHPASVLARGEVATRLPAQDLERARRFYAEKLGLEPVEERPGGLRYRCGTSYFALFASSGAPSGTHTQMGWEVDDIAAAVAELRARGVVFEEYDVPGLKTVNGIADISGNYPGKGTRERGAWFRDSEGNLLGIGQSIR
jgi:catechol 2,3-dioxygenase-like lactoylglutathione lyase family enzyme